MVAEVIVKLALSFAKPRNLAKYSNSKQKSTFISVSNSIITSKWLVKWLARSPSVSSIFLLHDIIPITHPEFTVPRTTRRHKVYVKRIVDTADAIIANSKFTYDCLVDYSNEQSFSVPQVAIAPLGVEDVFIRNVDNLRRDSSAGVPYFVFIATIEPRKNHLMLLHVWQRLADKFGSNCPKLILVGRRGWENENALDLIERSLPLRNHVMECSHVPDRLLVKLLEGASAALFPSHVEGFGLPLAEALSLGTPIICSDIPPFREIAGNIPEYVDPLAGRGWLRLITEFTNPKSQRRSAQLSRIRSFRPYRWSDHFLRLDAILAARQGTVGVFEEQFVEAAE